MGSRPDDAVAGAIVSEVSDAFVTVTGSVPETPANEAVIFTLPVFCLPRTVAKLDLPDDQITLSRPFRQGWLRLGSDFL